MKNISDFIKRYRKLFLILVVLSLVAYGVSFAIVVSSDAYKIAKEYVYNSNELNDRFGGIQQVNIVIGIKLGGGISYSRGRTKAHYNLNVATHSGIRKVHVRLEKINDVWNVMEYRVME